MKEIIKFLIFIIYTTSIFFLPNNSIIFILIFINIICMILAKVKIRKIFVNIISFFPFILFTAVINCFIDSYINALWIGIKLIIVCNITYIYSKTTTIMKVAKTIKYLCSPLKVFKINVEEIEIMVCISLTMIPILKKDLIEKEIHNLNYILFNRNEGSM